MHFFTEPSLLIEQESSDSYGPYTDKFSVSATLNVTSKAKIFACQDAMMIVQPYVDETGNVNNNLVNVILKPNQGLVIPFNPVKYYIYRGVEKTSFIQGSDIVPNSNTNKTEFITKFWQRWEQYKIDTNQPSISNPTPQNFGFDLSLTDGILLEEIYNSEESNNSVINDLQAIKVTEGEWIGNILTTNKFSFEVITDTDHLVLDLEYAKKSKHIIDLDGLPSSTPQEVFVLKAEKEKCLNYIDPAALFGMHYEVGVQVSTYSGTTKNTVTKFQGDVYTEVIDKFITKNDIYVDIRSEKGYSYNFYDNYDIVTTDGGGTIHQNIQYKGFSDSDYLSEVYGWPTGVFLPELVIWPIIIYSFDDNRINLKLRIDDNTKPLLFIENHSLLGKNKTSRFISDTELLQNSVDGWTDVITLSIPAIEENNEKKNIAYHVKLQYFRQEDSSTSPNTVLKSESYLDSIFGGIHYPLINTPTVFLNQKSAKRLFVTGSNFEYVTENSILNDTDNVVFLTRNGYSLKKSKNTYPKIDFSQFQSNKVIQNYILPENLIYNKWQVNDGTSAIDVLDIVGYNKINSQTIPIEDIFILGLTKTEWGLLDNVSGVSDLHHKYLYFEEIPNQSDVDTGTPYKKYKLKVQGLNNSGIVTSIAPATDVFVYGTGLNLLASRDFGNSTIIPNLIPDPGTFDEGYADVYRFNYDGNDSIVTNLFPTGTVTVQDIGNNQGKNNPEVGIIGEIFYPVDSINSTIISNKKNTYPLIVIIHGNGHRYSDYRSLATHLAKNGFIVTSISCLIASNKIFKLYAYSGTSAELYYCQGDDAIYVYNNDPNINNSYLEYEKLSVLNHEYDLNTGTGVSLLSWVKGVDFNINLSGTTPDELVFLFNIGEHGMASLGRANLLYKHLQVIKSKFGNVVENNIGIVGHSRGGESVVRVAKDIANSSAPTSLNNIKAILSLAPTDLWEEENLTQDIPYFVLYGSKDGDVSGLVSSVRMDGSNKIVGTGGFSLYDRTNNAKEKSMAFVYGATHNGFITDNHDYPDPTVKLESLTTQYAISKAYVNSFFRIYLKNEELWLPIFSDAFIPNSVNKKDIYLQHQNLANRNLIADFNEITPPDLATLVNVDSGFSFKKTEYNLRGNYPNFNYTNREDPFSPHFFDGLFIEYPANGGNVTINIPSSKKDASNYTFLSFRICHVSGTYKNTPRDANIQLFSSYNDLTKLSISLEDLLTSKHQVYIKKIPAPDERIKTNKNNLPAHLQWWTDDPALTKSALITIRIPLENYINNGVDISNLSKLSFIFPTFISGGFLNIDDIEYTN